MDARPVEAPYKFQKIHKGLHSEPYNIINNVSSINFKIHVERLIQRGFSDIMWNLF